jgi:uncharacterized HAD superfamily protein
MRIGFDIDGVLVDFYTGYENMTRKVTGRDLFPKRGEGDNSPYPPVWDWPEHYGYSKSEMRRVWTHIKNDESFWKDLQPLPDFQLVRRLVQKKPAALDLYFITARPGATVKHQTEWWMWGQAGLPTTILISEHKGYIARALKLDVLVDDKPENISDVAHWSPETRLYLPDRDYNREFRSTRECRFTRINSLGEMFAAEGLLPQQGQREKKAA